MKVRNKIYVLFVKIIFKIQLLGGGILYISTFQNPIWSKLFFKFNPTPTFI